MTSILFVGLLLIVDFGLGAGRRLLGGVGEEWAGTEIFADGEIVGDLGAFDCRRRRRDWEFGVWLRGKSLRTEAGMEGHIQGSLLGVQFRALYWGRIPMIHF